jgi:hypothetical protein
MGLDQYVYATKQAPSRPIDFEEELEAKEAREVHYWRKHPDLQGWMENLYRAKGGRESEFNLVPVVLSVADIDLLEIAVKEKALPTTRGFFFGHSDGSEMEDDLLFIRKARQALAQGLTIYYTSWW